jgi:hypothetical protein
MNRENIPTRRTLIVPPPLMNTFELYKIDPTPPIRRMRNIPVFKEFLSHNPLPYYIGNPEISGRGFWDDFKTGFVEGFDTTMKLGSHILPLIGLGKKKRGGKKKIMKEESEESASEVEEEAHELEHVKHEERENKHLDKIEKIAKDMKKANKKVLRGEMVRDLMRNKGMKLGQASRYIKEHNLI